ncbi:MAG: NYN domain-containing protein [Acidimicrobiia bacterium]
MSADEDRIALFIDYENLAIGARDALGAKSLDVAPINDALAERGRVVVRRAYADWSFFDADRRDLTRHQVELIEIPQRMGGRKNAADIKMVVDALELAFARDYLTTFCICTGDSDFTPLVHKLRELDKRVIGIGVKASTSGLLPPACDEFLFYERLEGVNLPAAPVRRRKSGNSRPAAATAKRSSKPSTATAAASQPEDGTDDDVAPDGPRGPADLDRRIGQTLAGLGQTQGGPVRASALKRALLRKDPTFSEADFGFRSFGELLGYLEDRGVVTVEADPTGDPQVEFATGGGDTKAFELLRAVVEAHERRNGPPQLSGLKNKVRKRDPDFSEKPFGFGGFLQFCKAAATRGFVELDWDEDAGDYLVRTAAGDVAD